jgi:type IV pilus assembly protein PilO
MRFGIRETIFLLLLLAMPVAGYFFVFEPRNAQIAEARDDVRQKQTRLHQLEAQTREVSNLGQQIDKLKDAITLFEHKLPAQREVDVILKQVWELAAKHQLTPKSIRTDKPVAAASYSELPIHIVIAGNFEGYYEFLRDLEKLRRITRMPQMHLKKVAGSEGWMEADLVLSIFFDTDDADSSGQAGRDRS